MAINDTSVSDTNGLNIKPAMQQTQAQPQAAQNQPRPGWSFHSGGLFGAPIGADLTSEYMSKLTTGLTEIYKEANPATEITLLSLDQSNEPALVFSALVVCMRLKASPKAGVAYHVLICEATNKALDPIIDTVNSQQVEIMRVTSDALDQVLVKKVSERVAAAFPGVTSHMVDACVIPRTFNPEDKFRLQQLALNAGMAVMTELEMALPEWADFNLGVNQRDSNLLINIAFTHQQLEDAVGQPMRSDLLVQFSSQKQKEQGRQDSSLVNTGDRDAKISEISGFIDMVYSPVVPMMGYNPYAQPMPQATQKYLARMIVTNLASNFAYTPSSVLLALATSLSVRDDNNWIQAFRPVNTGKDIDLHDIGALNIEANLSNEPGQYGTRINTKEDTFRLEDMGRLIAALVQPGLVMSLDCPENGPQSWYLSMFAAASNGSQAAYEAIYSAAQELTNGQFGKYFPQGSPMFVDTGNRVHLGTWIDAHGVKRDIRDIDTVAVANLIGDRDPQVIREWQDTFLRVNYPLAQRLAARKKIIMGLTNQQATFTGFAQRVTFESKFMTGLSQGIKDLGIPVRVATPLSSAAFTDSRGVATFAGQALMAPGATFMHTGGFNQQPQFATGFQHQYRW